MSWNVNKDVPIPGAIIPFEFDAADLRASINYEVARVYDSNTDGVLIPVAFFQDHDVVGLPFRPHGKTYVELSTKEV